MKTSTQHAPHGGTADWKSAQMVRFRTLADSLRTMIAAIETKHDEIASLRRAVCESARAAARRQPQMTGVAELIETTFVLTSPCHLGTARCVAADMQRVLERAIACLRELPDTETVSGLAAKTLGKTMEELLGNVGKTGRSLSQLLANAEREIQMLQAAFIEFSA
jgi:hypothetical protein